MATTDDIKIEQDVLPDTDPTRLARKRRRKTQSNGAVEDCFACQKRQITCDRRRPYCSPCLEFGKECSGYRTVLTWGVGVASRGKLRGMSLPIPIPGGKPMAKPPDVPRRRISFNVSTELPTPGKITSQSRVNRKRSASMKSDISDKPHSFQQPPPLPATIPEESLQSAHQNNWQLPPLRDLVFQDNQMANQPFSSFMHPPMHNPEFHLSRSDSMEESPLSSSTASNLSNGSLNSYSDTSMDTQFTPAPNASDTTLQEPYSNIYNDSLFPVDSDPPSGTPIEQLKYSNGLHDQNNYANNIFAQQPNDTQHSVVYSSHADTIMRMDTDNDWSSELAQPTTHIMAGNCDYHEMKTHISDKSDLLEEGNQLIQVTSGSQHMPSPTYAMSLYHIAPRMRYLLDYYDKVICPVLVAFDTTSNPYRMYMMQLASQNAGLQNAIAALVTNNMRMRNAKTTPHPPLDARLWELDDGEDQTSFVDRPSAEEQHYRRKSKQHLNAQLENPIKARDDSVLATLLILCLFHICDSGVSKFKTQLAGVQKLLRMRGQVFHSEFVGWVEMFFAWLDVMTSAVNDREVQVHGDSLDLMNLSANLGALEQYSGIDGRLFKLIARLSRLNLLSQSRPVRDTSDITPRPSPRIKTTDQPSPLLGYGQVTQNGVPIVTQTSPGMFEYDFAIGEPDNRTMFWQEWRDLRQRLKDWEGYYYYEPVINSFDEPPSPQRDMHHISESFRYSALLYTERLAFPNLPSSSQNFQDLVTEALYHCTEIPGDSCILKFMLWPMFIIGTECVDERHRELIRNRCIQIQEESGFYNNMNGLRVLERVWKEYDEGTVVRPGCRNQAFRWRNAMNCVDGEYIVI